MITRVRTGIFQPDPKHTLTSASSISAVHFGARATLQDPNWHATMQEGFNALLRNKTWTLVPRPPGARVVFGKWVFKIKTGSDSSFDCYKARLVVRNDVQSPRIDFNETFSRSSKSATIHTVLMMIASKHRPAHQLDASNAFLPSDLDE
jgi:histone deacetylase 1/2